jgi:hypothetical protein
LFLFSLLCFVLFCFLFLLLLFFPWNTRIARISKIAHDYP